MADRKVKIHIGLDQKTVSSAEVASSGILEGQSSNRDSEKLVNVTQSSDLNEDNKPNLSSKNTGTGPKQPKSVKDVADTTLPVYEPGSGWRSAGKGSLKSFHPGKHKSRKIESYDQGWAMNVRPGIPQARPWGDWYQNRQVQSGASGRKSMVCANERNSAERFRYYPCECFPCAQRNRSIFVRICGNNGSTIPHEMLDRLKSGIGKRFGAIEEGFALPNYPLQLIIR